MNESFEISSRDIVTDKRWNVCRYIQSIDYCFLSVISFQWNFSHLSIFHKWFWTTILFSYLIPSFDNFNKKEKNTTVCSVNSEYILTRWSPSANRVGFLRGHESFEALYCFLYFFFIFVFLFFFSCFYFFYSFC